MRWVPLPGHRPFTCLACGRGTMDAGPFLETDPAQVDWQGTAMGEGGHKVPIYLCLADVLMLGTLMGSPVEVTRKADAAERDEFFQGVLAERDDLAARVAELEGALAVERDRLAGIDPSKIAAQVARSVKSEIRSATSSSRGRVAVNTTAPAGRGGDSGKPARN